METQVKKEYPRSGKFTFKKTVHTGRFRSFEDDSYEIKHMGSMVGLINELGGKSYDRTPPELVGKFKISFMIKKEPTKEEPSDFTWITLKKVCDTAEEAKQWLNANANGIQQKWDLRHSERD